MSRLKKASLTALALTAAIALTFGSAYIERVGPEMAAYGNLCGPSASELCYEPVLKGGFPVAYLFDAPGISVEHQLSFGEDELSIGALLLDIAFYFGLGLLAFRLTPRQIP
jgi:hypothetical protein